MDGRGSTSIPLRDALRRGGLHLAPRGRLIAGIVLALLVWRCCLTPIAFAAEVTPIYVIQGATNQSPLAGQTVDAVGIVTGVTDTGFYLQDPVGDGSPATSDGLFVYTYRRPAVETGACVEVRGGQVTEFYGKTELNRATSYGPARGCAANLIAPIALPIVLPGQSPVAALEPFEGTLVQLATLDAVVYGPTKTFDSGEREIAVLPAALQPYLESANIDQADAAAQASLLFLSNQLGATLPATDRGDTLTGAALVGVLDYNFGKYQLLLVDGPPLAVEHAAGSPSGAPVLVPEQPGDYSVCTYNVHGLGRGQAQYVQADDYAAALHGRAAAIAGPLQGCTMVALQETGAPADAQALAETLAADYGLSYTVAALDGPASHDAEFPLTNSLLVRQDRGRVATMDQVQGCATRDYGLSAPGGCPAGQYPAFDRPPLIAEVVMDETGDRPQRIWIVNNHWKSKSGDETVNARLRAEQAAAVARTVQALVDADPAAQVIVLGDLNDFYDGPAVTEMAGSITPPLTHLYDQVAPLDRYTYIFNGATQVLDHMLITPNLERQVAAVQIVHINADFAADAPESPGYATSDHDPARLVVRPAGASGVGGNLAFEGVTVTARDAGGAAVAATVTDADGEFRLWGLAPGQVTLVYAPPPAVMMDATQQTVALVAGYTVVTPPITRHQTPMLAAWIALAGPDLTNQLMVESPVP